MKKEYTPENHTQDKQQQFTLETKALGYKEVDYAHVCNWELIAKFYWTQKNENAERLGKSTEALQKVTIEKNRLELTVASYKDEATGLETEVKRLRQEQSTHSRTIQKFQEQIAVFNKMQVEYERSKNTLAVAEEERRWNVQDRARLLTLLEKVKAQAEIVQEMAKTHLKKTAHTRVEAEVLVELFEQLVGIPDGPIQEAKRDIARICASAD